MGRSSLDIKTGIAPSELKTPNMVPGLMSNEDRPITIFNLYYYGAGRWGGWPFLFAQVARLTTGYRWSDQSLFSAQAASVLLGAMIIAGLSRRDRLPVALIYLLTICLHG